MSHIRISAGLIGLALPVSGLLLLPAGGAAQIYNIVSIDVPCADCPGGIARSTSAMGINPAGDIVGWYADKPTQPPPQPRSEVRGRLRKGRFEKECWRLDQRVRVFNRRALARIAGEILGNPLSSGCSAVARTDFQPDPERQGEAGQSHLL